jgi:hypothetical protein
MNIFALDQDPVRAAQMQCDNHVVKMTLETGQILSTIQRAYGNTDAILYRSTHIHHPCVLWAGDSFENYGWLVRHFYALAGEYAHRYGRSHLTLKKRAMTPFALAMPDVYKSDDPIDSYRRYYKGSKAHLLKYTKREKPSWM